MQMDQEAFISQQASAHNNNAWALSPFTPFHIRQIVFPFLPSRWLCHRWYLEVRNPPFMSFYLHRFWDCHLKKKSSFRKMDKTRRTWSCSTAEKCHTWWFRKVWFVQPSENQTDGSLFIQLLGVEILKAVCTIEWFKLVFWIYSRVLKNLNKDFTNCLIWFATIKGVQ